MRTNAGRIALIAHIVGGWLLPILHEHGSHQHSDSVTAEGASCVPKPPSDVTSTCGFRSHSHPRSLQNERHASDPKQKQESPQLQHKFPSAAATARIIGASDHTPNSPVGHFEDFRSNHAAGAQFLPSDGSVRMITHFIDLDIYHALTTRANKEVIDGRDF